MGDSTEPAGCPTCGAIHKDTDPYACSDPFHAPAVPDVEGPCDIFHNGSDEPCAGPRFDDPLPEATLRVCAFHTLLNRNQWVRDCEEARATLRSLSVQPEVERWRVALNEAAQDAHYYGLVRDHWKRNADEVGPFGECDARQCVEARALLDAQRTNR